MESSSLRVAFKMAPNEVSAAAAILEIDSFSEDYYTTDAEMNVISNKMRDLQQKRLKVVEKWTINKDCDVTNDQMDQQTVKNEKNSDVSRMNTAMTTLRIELAELLSQDGAIFEQLLTLRRTIAQLKQQSIVDEDDLDDPEVTYLSVGAANVKNGRQVAPRKTSVDSGSCLTSFENSSEESAFSVESSESTSPSTSPVPIVALSGVADSPCCNGSDHWTTFPPDSSQSQKCYNLGKSKSSSNLLLIGCNEKGVSSRRRKSEHYLPFRGALKEYGAIDIDGSSSALSPLVRSTSITVLPRGVLVRRESSFDSGFHGLGLPSYGEVFV